ncbi:TPA: hypothetical protein ACXNQL_002235 [Stenotrophomonas maltophilia]
MNTTMADGASERLDAQIADALFGQPGMSKMELANRLRELRGAGAPVLADVGNPISPSPARQGEAHDCLAATLGDLLLRGWIDDVSGKLIGEAARKDMATALAARQPVAAAVKDSLTVGGGQTLVQEPAGWQTMASCPRDGTAVLLRWGEDHVSPGWWCADATPIQNEDGTWSSDNGGFPWAFFDLNDGVAFVNHAVDTVHGPTHWAPYVYPPAQAVDLGQFRGLIGFATYHAINLPETDPRRDFIRQANEFLALIDGDASAGEPNTAPNRLTDTAQANLFYIQDTRQFVGNCPMWWGPNGSGYVTRLDEAGRYTEQEAIRQNRTRETDIPWPCSEIDALARQTVDCQHMRPRAERLAELALIDSKAVG